ncbi:MAG: tetratricopeptide repeat protein [Planctomycetota bacterium]
MRLSTSLPAGWIGWLPLIWLVLFLPGPRESWGGHKGDAAIARSQAELQARIRDLIEQLGATRYVDRERARRELERLRMEAFDALNDARFHDDIEIALSARNLVRGMQVKWCTEDDSAEVKQLLRTYGSQKEAERREAMQRLSRLGREVSLGPLCRLVRYEASERLSRRAALLTLALPPPSDEAARREFAEALLTRMGTSGRPAAEWLRAYAELLTDSPGCHQRWTDLIALEQARLANNPDQKSKAVTRDLMRWYADQLSRRDRTEDALAMMRQTIELLDADHEQVLDAADWFRARESWPIIVDLADRFSGLFEGHPLLQYRLAESYRELKQDDKAEKAAELALKAMPDEPKSHLEIAYDLQRDGLFEWAEYEYRHLIRQVEVQPMEAVQGRFALSEMLHDVGRDQAAGEVLRGLVKQLETQEEVRQIIEEETRRDVAAIESRMHFFFAEHHAKQEDHARQRDLLSEGYKHNPHDADVLIAMYRVPEAKPAWQEKTRKRIQEAVEFFRGQLKDLEERWGELDGREKAMTQLELATINNQLAWLIANTEGDLDEALRCSKMSLELRPDQPAGFLDTLGHCYYARGEYEKAVQYQSQAVALEPNSPSIIGALELFEEARRQQQAASEDAKLGEKESSQ